MGLDAEGSGDSREQSLVSSPKLGASQPVGEPAGVDRVCSGDGQQAVATRLACVEEFAVAYTCVFSAGHDRTVCVVSIAVEPTTSLANWLRLSPLAKACTVK